MLRGQLYQRQLRADTEPTGAGFERPLSHRLPPFGQRPQSALCAGSLKRWRMPVRAHAVLPEASPVDPILAFRGVRRSGAVGKDSLSV